MGRKKRSKKERRERARRVFRVILNILTFGIPHLASRGGKAKKVANVLDKGTEIADELTKE